MFWYFIMELCDWAGKYSSSIHGAICIAGCTTEVVYHVFLIWAIVKIIKILER